MFKRSPKKKAAAKSKVYSPPEKTNDAEPAAAKRNTVGTAEPTRRAPRKLIPRMTTDDDGGEYERWRSVVEDTLFSGGKDLPRRPDSDSDEGDDRIPVGRQRSASVGATPARRTVDFSKKRMVRKFSTSSDPTNACTTIEADPFPGRSERPRPNRFASASDDDVDYLSDFSAADEIRIGHRGSMSDSEVDLPRRRLISNEPAAQSDYDSDDAQYDVRKMKNDSRVHPGLHRRFTSEESVDVRHPGAQPPPNRPAPGARNIILQNFSTSEEMYLEGIISDSRFLERAHGDREEGPSSGSAQKKGLRRFATSEQDESAAGTRQGVIQRYGRASNRGVQFIDEDGYIRRMPSEDRSDGSCCSDIIVMKECVPRGSRARQKTVEDEKPRARARTEEEVPRSPRARARTEEEIPRSPRARARTEEETPRDAHRKKHVGEETPKTPHTQARLKIPEERRTKDSQPRSSSRSKPEPIVEAHSSEEDLSSSGRETPVRRTRKSGRKRSDGKREEKKDKKDELSSEEDVSSSDRDTVSPKVRKSGRKRSDGKQDKKDDKKDKKEDKKDDRRDKKDDKKDKKDDKKDKKDDSKDKKDDSKGRASRARSKTRKTKSEEMPQTKKMETDLGEPYLVDNSVLRAPTEGINFRNSPVMADKDAENIAKWGGLVYGTPYQEDTNWLEVGDRYLPFKVNGIQILWLQHTQWIEAKTKEAEKEKETKKAKPAVAKSNNSDEKGVESSSDLASFLKKKTEKKAATARKSGVSSVSARSKGSAKKKAGSSPAS